MIRSPNRLPVSRRCELLGVRQSTAYDRPKAESEEEPGRMRWVDEIHLEPPFYGSRRLTGELQGRGRWLDNVFIDQLWRSVPYAGIDLRADRTPGTLRTGLARSFDFYTGRRCHAALRPRHPGRGVLHSETASGSMRASEVLALSP